MKIECPLCRQILQVNASRDKKNPLYPKHSAIKKSTSVKLPVHYRTICYDGRLVVGFNERIVKFQYACSGSGARVVF